VTVTRKFKSFYGDNNEYVNLRGTTWFPNAFAALRQEWARVYTLQASLPSAKHCFPRYPLYRIYSPSDFSSSAISHISRFACSPLPIALYFSYSHPYHEQLQEMSPWFSPPFLSLRSLQLLILVSHTSSFLCR